MGGEAERGGKGKFGVAVEATLLFCVHKAPKPPHVTSSILGMLSPDSARRRLPCVSYLCHFCKLTPVCSRCLCMHLHRFTEWHF